MYLIGICVRDCKEYGSEVEDKFIFFIVIVFWVIRKGLIGVGLIFVIIGWFVMYFILIFVFEKI